MGASPLRVRGKEGFRQAVLSAKTGTTILLAPGVYEGNPYFEEVKGRSGKPIIIAGEDPSNRPTIKVGPKGNRDGIKLSGVTDFKTERCVIEQWGDEGQGIDMVGCHQGIINNCILRYEDDKRGRYPGERREFRYFH